MSRLSILVIEDEPATRRMLQRLLERDGHSVVVAGNGLEGIDIFKNALLQQKPFDLVITDYGLPQMSGGEVAKTIKALSPSTPVIVISGWDSAYSIDSDTYGIFDCLLNKPVANQEIRTAIKRVMAKSRSSQQVTD